VGKEKYDFEEPFFSFSILLPLEEGNTLPCCCSGEMILGKRRSGRMQNRNLGISPYLSNEGRGNLRGERVEVFRGDILGFITAE